MKHRSCMEAMRLKYLVEHRNTVLTVLKFLVAALVLSLLLSGIHLQELMEALRRVNKWILSAALAIAALQWLVPTYLWSLLLFCQGIKPPFRRLAAINYMGFFFANFTPSGVGGDVLKIYMLSEETNKVLDVSTSVVVLRLTSLLALLVTATIASFFAAEVIRNFVLPLLGSVMFIILLVVLLRKRLVERIEALSDLPGTGGIPAALRGAYHSFTHFRAQSRQVLLVFLLAMLLHASGFIVPYLVGLSLGLQVSATYLATLVPLVHLLALLPISPNGLGVREAAYVLSFTQAGVTPSAAVSFALLNYLSVVFVSLIGATIYLISHVFNIKSSQGSMKHPTGSTPIQRS